MRARAAIVLGMMSAASGGGVVACFDLFHSTAGLRDACQIDWRNCPADFCAWSPAEARDHAAHACAWLGACGTSSGDQGFGSCMFQALLAYDCAANPSHLVKGAEHERWECLERAQSCSDVSACTGAEEAGEADGGCPARECVTAQGRIHWCADGGDVGIDCRSNGAQACGGFPSNAPGWVACLPAGDAGCDPDASASCSDGVATSCPAGIVETIDCDDLLEAGAQSCSPGQLSPPFDWTSPCVLASPTCTSDSCGGTTLTGCARGASFHVDCRQQGLGPCVVIASDAGAPRAACAPPGDDP